MDSQHGEHSFSADLRTYKLNLLGEVSKTSIISVSKSSGAIVEGPQGGLSGSGARPRCLQTRGSNGSAALPLQLAQRTPIHICSSVCEG